MSTVAEIEIALKELPLQEVQEVARWLQKYLEQKHDGKAALNNQAPIKLPDYAARRRMIFGEKIVPNMVLLGREQERW